MVEPTKARVAVRARSGPLDDAAADEVRALAARAGRADGVPPLSEQPLLWLTSAEAPTVHVEAREGGVLAGYAQVDVGSGTTARAELVVEPGLRRAGVGRALLAAAAMVAARVEGRRLAVWAHGDLPAARAFAAHADMAVVRELWQMRVDLGVREPLARPLPSGVTVRAFVPGQDEEAWRRVNSRAFAYHPEQGRMTKEDLLAREAEPWFDPAGFLLAEREGKLLGSVWTKVHDDGPVGEIYVVGVDPDAQGLGLGGALTELGLAYLRGRGLRAAILYTGAENEVAVRTYVRAGFERSAVDVMFGTDSPVDTASSLGGATMTP